jgi:large subunit ribosomal protein L10
MDEARPEKVAVVDEVRRRFAESDGAVLTEYRGLDVGAMSELRRALREAGGDYHIYKNSLVRRAVADLDADLEEFLVGPTAIAFVQPGPDGTPGDAAAVAKALKEFARTNEALVVKGGVLGSHVLSAQETRALAELPSKEVLLGQFAGLLQAPLTKFARLLNAVPAKFAYGMHALIEAGGAPGAPQAPAANDSPTGDSPTDDSPTDDSPTDDSPTDDSPTDDSPTETPQES